MPAPTMIQLETPPRLGLYSHAALVPAGCRVLFMGGRASVGADGSTVGVGDIAAQVRQAFDNMRQVLASADMGFANVVLLTTYLVGEENIAGFYEARARIFDEAYPDKQYPPNTLLIVSRLVHADMLIEIQGIAAG
jgi:enamine deaminase RidA (YjgF/YER057c/UK114 family)